MHQWWEVASLRIRKLEKAGDSCRVYFYEPESRIQNEHPWPAPWLSSETGNSAFYLGNALALLDEPGEWYYDAGTRKIFYYPRAGDDMAAAETILPVSEHIFVINGTLEQPVQNVVIKGLRFRHSAWRRPSLQGHVPHQADYHELRYAITDKKGEKRLISWGDKELNHYFRFEGQSHHAGEYQNYLDYFADSIINDTTAYPDMREGIGTVALLQAMNQSLKTRQPVGVKSLLKEYGLGKL